MALRDYTDVYVAACGKPFESYYFGKQHEKDCPYCARGVDDGHIDYFGDDDEDEPAPVPQSLLTPRVDLCAVPSEAAHDWYEVWAPKYEGVCITPPVIPKGGDE